MYSWTDYTVRQSSCITDSWEHIDWFWYPLYEESVEDMERVLEVWGGCGRYEESVRELWSDCGIFGSVGGVGRVWELLTRTQNPLVSCQK